MKRTLFISAVVVLALTKPALAHRLDECLQAATVTLEKDHVAIQLRLTSGVAVFI